MSDWEACEHCVHTQKEVHPCSLSDSHTHTHTPWRKVTYRKASGQSSLDIHCHWMCAGVGNPRAVHLRVGLLPYGYTSVSTATSFSMIWGGTVGEDRRRVSTTVSWPTASGSSRRNRKKQRIHAVDQQLERASLFLSSNLIGQDHCIIPCIHFCDSTDDEDITFLLYSVIILQW